MLDVQFDMERFLETAGQVDLSDIPWEDVPKYPLSPEALRTIRYFLQTESATFYYLRSAMSTRAAMEEPDFAPFLCTWSFEEEFHGRAFKRFLQAYGEPVDAYFRGQMFARRGAGERVDELIALSISTLLPEQWPAAHMVWGASAEFTTYMGYVQLVKRTDHPILHTICKRIMKQEARHFAFYQAQARDRLAASKTAQRLVSALLHAAWTPVGDGMSPKEEVCHTLRFLFDGAEGDVIPQIEAKIRSLPGLEWFDLFTRYVRRHEIKKAPASWFDHARGQRAPAAAE
jgi:hypothetical protein